MMVNGMVNKHDMKDWNQDRWMDWILIVKKSGILDLEVEVGKEVEVETKVEVEAENRSWNRKLKYRQK